MDGLTVLVARGRRSQAAGGHDRQDTGEDAEPDPALHTYDSRRFLVDEAGKVVVNEFPD